MPTNSQRPTQRQSRATQQQDAQFNDAQAAKLHEHGVFVASDRLYQNNLVAAIQYYEQEKFNNTLHAAQLEQNRTTTNGTTLESPTPIKTHIGHWSGPLNFARLFLLRIQREVNAVAKMTNTTAVTSAIKGTSKPLAVIAWAYYIPRLFYTLLNASSHHNKEGNANAGAYLWKNRFNISNDMAWLGTGLTTCGITMNWWSLPLLGPHGMYLTVGLYAFDVINTAARCQSEINSLQQLANTRGIHQNTKDKITAKIDYLKAKRNANTLVALGLLTGMAVSLCPPIAVVGASIVVATCLISFFCKDRYLSKKEINTSTNAVALLHHKLVLHVAKQIDRMKKKKPTENRRKKIERYQAIKKKLDTWQWKPNSEQTAYSELNTILQDLKKSSSTDVAAQTFFASKPKTETELNNVLAPFKDHHWKHNKSVAKYYKQLKATLTAKKTDRNGIENNALVRSNPQTAAA